MTDMNDQRRIRIISCFHLSVLGARRCLRRYVRPGEPHSQIECPRPASYRVKVSEEESEFLCTWCLLLYGSRKVASGKEATTSAQDVVRAPHADAIDGLSDALEEPAGMLTFNMDVIEDARSFLTALPPCREDPDCARCVWMPEAPGRLALYELTKALSFEKPFDNWPTNPAEELHRIFTQPTYN